MERNIQFRKRNIQVVDDIYFLNNEKRRFFFQFDEMKYLSIPTFANYWIELMYWAQPNSKQFSRDCSCR